MHVRSSSLAPPRLHVYKPSQAALTPTQFSNHSLPHLPLSLQEPAELVEAGRLPQRCRCNVPTSTTVAAGTAYGAAAAQVAAHGLHYPLLAKPLWADGREGSHALAGDWLMRQQTAALARIACFLPTVTQPPLPSAPSPASHAAYCS
jgi:hypothetical protein